VALLARRTEGWIAGLQMATLALQPARSSQSQEGFSSFIQSFTGSSRFILDYLVEEVFHQPAEINFSAEYLHSRTPVWTCAT
jgi:LuxR family maltose regulon positive regulatory protein